MEKVKPEFRRIEDAYEFAVEAINAALRHLGISEIWVEYSSVPDLIIWFRGNPLGVKSEQYSIVLAGDLIVNYYPPENGDEDSWAEVNSPRLRRDVGQVLVAVAEIVYALVEFYNKHYASH